MKLRKKTIWIAWLVILILIITGCSQKQQKIFNAFIKMQDVKSMQEHTTMAIQLSSSDFEPEIQQQLDQAAMFLNNAQLNLDAKTICNEQKTSVKSQVSINLSSGGTNINMPFWIDSDISGDIPKLTEIFKLPPIAKESLPLQFRNKEYIVINPFEINNSGLNEKDLLNYITMSKTFQEKMNSFLISYSQRFNPNFVVVDKGIQDIETNNGPKSAQIYSIKFNDEQFKDFIRYSVNNFIQDKEAMSFVRDFMCLILEAGQIPDKENSLADLDQAFNNLETNTPQFLTQFNAGMDQLKDVPFLGEKGLELEYAVADGYLIKENETIDLQLDIAKIGQFVNALNKQKNTLEDAKGTLNLLINLETNIFDINYPIDIQIPEVNKDNSFNFQDLIYYLSNPTRLSGLDRYQTAVTISEQLNSGTISDVIIASGENFPDALSASVLAGKLKAPILLIDSQGQSYDQVMNYLSKHLDKAGTVYILGGSKLISTEFETKLNQIGVSNLERIAGYDRYATNILVAKKLGVQKNTPMVIVSGENFPDALSISSIAGSKGYPILLVGKDYLTQEAKDFITDDQPSQIYIMGGTGAISESIQSEIQNLLPSCLITRLAGSDRYDTAGQVLNTFSLNPQTIYFASGNNFPDALAGSALASVSGNPILLIDSNSANLPPAIEGYLKKLYDSNIHPSITSFGGTAVVPDAVLDKAKSILNGNP
jgi:putative cell wall-binding protein